MTEPASTHRSQLLRELGAIVHQLKDGEIHTLLNFAKALSGQRKEKREDRNKQYQERLK